jgi:Ca2+/H+ antiporter
MSTMAHAKERKLFTLLLSEAPTIIAILSLALAFLFRNSLYADLGNYPRTTLIFLWLFGATAYGAFGVVRHADAVADKLGEPYGTLVLTFSVIAIEVAMMSTIMLHGADNPTLARDAMFATLMIVLNGLVGIALLVGALRYWEQEYNLEGARPSLWSLPRSRYLPSSSRTLHKPRQTQTDHHPRQNCSRSPSFSFMVYSSSFRRCGIAL